MGKKVHSHLFIRKQMRVDALPKPANWTFLPLFEADSRADHQPGAAFAPAAESGSRQLELGLLPSGTHTHTHTHGNAACPFKRTWT